MLKPDNGVPLPDIKNHKCAPIKLNRLRVVYHHPPNLGDALRPKTMELESGLPVSALCDEMREAQQQQQQQLPTSNFQQQQQQQEQVVARPVRMYDMFSRG